MKKYALILFGLLLIQGVLVAQNEVLDWKSLPINNSKTVKTISHETVNLTFQNLPSIEKIIIDGTEIKNFDKDIKAEESKTVVGIYDMLENTSNLKNLISPNNKKGFNLSIKTKDGSTKNFKFELEKDSEVNQSTTNKIDPTRIPFPIFSEKSKTNYELEVKKRNRVLIIDCNNNPKHRRHNTLYQLTEEENDEDKKKEDNNAGKKKGEAKVNGGNGDEAKDDKSKKVTINFEKANHVYVNSSIAVVLSNYSLNNIEKLSVEMDSENYSFENDINSLKDMLSTKKSTNEIANTEAEDGNNPDRNVDQESKLENYLMNVIGYYETLSKDYWSFSELAALQSYKQELKTACNSLDSIQPGELYLLSEILSWYPKHISLTSISMQVPNKDFISIKVKVKEKEKDEEIHEVGTYRCVGGYSTSASAAIFVTKLVNGKSHIDSMNVIQSDSTTQMELRASMNRDKYAVGIGANVETYFRTKYYVHPLINVGMYVPFEEEVSPYLTMGVGLALVLKDFKLSASIGPAGGYVNRINPKYVDKDLSLYPDHGSDLIDKQLKLDWQIGLSISYNINNGNKK